MNKERAMKLLENLVENVKNTYSSAQSIKVLVNDYGFEGVELVREFGFLRSAVETVTGEPIIDKISVSVYRDTCDPGFKGDDNMCELLVDRDELKRYFRGFASAKYTKELTPENEEELFEKWLGDYTCEDTDDLYVFIGGRTSDAFKTFFTEAYHKKHNRLFMEADCTGISDPAEYADNAFADEANADEVAGYYIAHYGNEALKTWLKNQSASAGTRDEKYKEQDKEVTRILEGLYGTGCYGAGSYACLNHCTGCDPWDGADNPDNWICNGESADEEQPDEAILSRNDDVTIRLNVKIWADTLLLFDSARKKEGYEVAEKVKDALFSSSFYCDTIHKEMEERNILSEYIDLFDCADTDVIVDKYCTVFDDMVEFDYSESAELDRRECYFTVPVDFNLSKYIRYMDQGEEMSA